MAVEQTYTLSNGVKIPKMGMGVWQVPNASVPALVKQAAEFGYRLIDTARVYENEQGVGEGVRECGIPRDEMFVVTKIPPSLNTYQDAVRAIDQSCQRLNVGAVDLMLVHAPRPWDIRDPKEAPRHEENLQIWKAMEDALEAGKVRAIGISNFMQEDVDNILSGCKVPPMVNQIRCNVGDTPLELLDYLKEKGIIPMAFSPIGHGRLLKDAEAKLYARKYGVTTAQLCIRYDIQLGTIPIPKTTREKYLKENLEVSFDIPEEDMEILKEMHRK